MGAIDPDSGRREPEALLAEAGWVRNLALTLARDAASADDVAQGTLALALERRPREDGSLRPWLARVADRLARSARRSDARRRLREVQAAARSRATAPGSDELLARLEEQERLSARVRALPEPYRGVLLRRFYEGQSAAQIARATGASAATVRSQLARGLERLRVEDARRSLDALEKIIGPSHVDGIAIRCEIDWRLGRREEALSAYRKLAARADVSKFWIHSLSDHLIDTGKTEEAIRLLTPLRTGAGSRRESYGIGRAHLESGNAEAALEMFSSISSGDTRWNEWNMDLWLARALAESGDVKAARRHFDRAPSRARGTPLGKRAEIALLEVSDDPELVTRLTRLKEDIRSFESLRPKLEALQQRISQTSWPRQGQLHLELATALDAIGERALALRHARLALDADPNSAAALEKLVDWMDGVGDAFLRLAYLRRRARLGPDDAAVARELSELERRLLPEESES